MLRDYIWLGLLIAGLIVVGLDFAGVEDLGFGPR
jgi:hypothetical protein